MSLTDLKNTTPWPPIAILRDPQWVQSAAFDLLRVFQKSTGQEKAEAFSALYNRYCQSLWDYIYRQVDGAEADAKDIFGQVWLVAVEELQTFHYRLDTMADDPLRAWLFRCAANRIKQFYREKRSQAPLDLVEGFLLARLSGMDTALYELFAPTVKSQAGDLLYAATKDLTPEQKVILRLRYHGSMSFAEIGTYLGKSEGSVKVQHHRLLKKLRTLLEQVIPSPGGWTMADDG
ncbi:MAG: sigma-70 family RNA polymerase sigma factor [Caldilineaceae bacterium]|nr:sigma-70 family RNA polymerase sigma factor [Caldilineaceae bacterium]